jgi:hypothetical protein
LWSALLSGAPGFVREEMLRLARETAVARPNSWLPLDLGAMLSVSAMIEVLGWWLRHPDPPPDTEIAEILDRVAVSPMEAGGR